MPSDIVRVLIVETQPLFAAALRAAFDADPGFVAVGAHQCPPREVRTQVDLVILDIDGQTADLETTLGACRAAMPNARVAVLSMRRLWQTARTALAAGADAYIVKDITLTDFVAIAKRVAAGESFVDAQLAGDLFRRRPSGREPMKELSDREADVVRLIAAGLANKEISARLHLSEKTVKNHISRIFTKLNLSARSQAAVYAVRMGIAS